MDKMPKYQQEQKKAWNIIVYERLDGPILDRISNCDTVCDIFAKLDEEYQAHSKIAMVALIRKWRSIRFRENENIKNHLLKHEQIAAELMQGGKELTDEDRVI